MYGFNHIPLAQRAIQVDEFIGKYGSALSVATQWETYTIPINASFLYISLVGGGADGGVPTVGAAATGAGGGGSGAITKCLIPTFLLPKVIYIQLGTPQSNSSVSKISITPTITPADYIITASNGRIGAVTLGGQSGPAFTSAGTWAGSLALWISQIGASGGDGAATNGAAAAALGVLPLTGGGGGGGSSAGTGGNVTGAGPFPTISGGASGANPGRAGMMLRQPFGGVGGSGGGGVNAAGTGLNFGGAGAIGCGGGGGGNAASGTPGAGGKGGPGYCLIVAF